MRPWPGYTVLERQPVSVTLTRRQGSCSQRLASLEALARWRGVRTRVRPLWVAGAFWNRRFALTRHFIPHRILLAWPQFRIDDGWMSVEEIYGPAEERGRDASAFTNDGETLFEAIRSTVVDFDGRLSACGNGCDLSRFVVDSGDVFERRDDLFAQLGSFEDTWRGSAFEWLYGGRSSR
jgi:hypothetical protein